MRCIRSAWAWGAVATVLATAPAAAVQVCDNGPARSSPTQAFDDHADGTVTHRARQLMWMRCSVGQTLDGGSCRGSAQRLDWAAAQAAAAELNASGRLFFKDWRVPQLGELASITERHCRNPRVNSAVFPNTATDYYWTVTPRAAVKPETSAYGLNFGEDGVADFVKSEALHVRLVRTAP